MDLEHVSGPEDGCFWRMDRHGARTRGTLWPRTRSNLGGARGTHSEHAPGSRRSTWLKFGRSCVNIGRKHPTLFRNHLEIARHGSDLVEAASNLVKTRQHVVGPAKIWSNPQRTWSKACPNYRSGGVRGSEAAVASPVSCGKKHQTISAKIGRTTPSEQVASSPIGMMMKSDRL